MLPRRLRSVASRRSTPSHEHRALGRVVEARDEFRERGLAAARLADERDHPPRGDAQGDVAQHAPLLVAVAEVDALQLDGLAQSGPSSTASGFSGISARSSITSQTWRAAASACSMPLCSRESLRIGS